MSVSSQEQSLCYVFGGQPPVNSDPAWKQGTDFFFGAQDEQPKRLYLGGVADAPRTLSVAVFRENPPHEGFNKLGFAAHVALFQFVGKKNSIGETIKWVIVTPLIVGHVDGHKVFFRRDPNGREDEFMFGVDAVR